MKKYRKLVIHSIPALLAILIAELVDVEVYLFGPVSKGSLMLVFWLTLQLIPGFVFGYISDKHYRKKILILSQIIGFVGGLILAFFGFQNWVLILIALTFNPMPVARAAFIDNFKEHSILKLLAITFLVQWIPWSFFDFLGLIDPKYVINLVIGALLFNTVFTHFFFKDNPDAKKRKTVVEFPWRLLKPNSPLSATLIALTLSEMTFYLVWVFFEYHPKVHHWLATTTIATLIGICIAMLFAQLPHMTSLTLFYSIGAGIVFMSLLMCMGNYSCDNALVSAMVHYSIIGGLYLPFVADAIFRLIGPKHLAVGAAFLEFSDTIAFFLAPIIHIIFKINTISLFVLIIALYLSAVAFQSYATKKYGKSLKHA